MSFFGSRPSYYGADSYFSSPYTSSYFPSSGTTTSWAKTAMYIVGGVFLIFVGIAFYDYLRKQQGLTPILSSDTSSGDKTPAPVDGKTKTTISASEVPIGAGSDYAMQFWMYIKDWDYKFSQEKQVVKRIGTGTDVNPMVTLHPTDNSLNVKVMIYPNSPNAGTASTPNTSSTGDSFTCTVENVPLQSWFAVSVTVFQRNLDIYINGRLVKSCVLPGIPKPVVGDIILGDNGGFSGSICNFHSYPNAIGPDESKAFYQAGTSCQAPTPGGPLSKPDSTFITIFGYTFRFSTLDKSGKELNSYTL